MPVVVNCIQLIGSGDCRGLNVGVFPHNTRPNPTTLFVGGVSNREAKALGYRIDVMLGAYNGHLLLGHRAHAHFTPDGIDLVPTADMAFVAAIMAERWHGVTDLSGYAFCGEVNEDRFVPLANPLQAGLLAKQHGLRLVCPLESAPVAAMTGATTFGVATADDLADLVCGSPPPPARPTNKFTVAPPCGIDMRYIKGQEVPRRALEIAVAGGHNLLMVGPPGEGKSLLAKTIPTIAPPMNIEEMVETTSIHKQHGLLDGDLMTERPVRTVDPSVTKQAMIGGGHIDPYPGEASLAHNGVLFCDEILQFKPAVIEALRGPLQDGRVVISRVNWKITWPANFQLVAACNPCPCGYWGHPTRSCTCTSSKRRNYTTKLSGPVIDRIPIRVWVHPLGDEKFDPPNGEPSATVRKRIMEARERQKSRGVTNDDIGPAEQHLIQLSRPAETLIRETDLSTRSVDNLRKVARTVADLEGSAVVMPEHLEEAAQFLEVELPRD